MRTRYRGFVSVHALSAITLSLVLLLMVVMQHAAFQSLAHRAAVITAVLIDLANDSRVGAQAPHLTYNTQLQAAAQLKANDMAAKGYFAHQSPDGKMPWDWIALVGYPYVYAGENLAVDFNDSKEVNQAWLNSPTHRANLLNPHFTEIGIATAEGMYQGRPTTFVVQLFGSRDAGQQVTRSIATVATEEIPVSEVSPTVLAVAAAPEAPTAEVLGESTVVDDVSDERALAASSAPTPRTHSTDTTVARSETLPEESAVPTSSAEPEASMLPQNVAPAPEMIPLEDGAYSTWFERVLSAPLTTLTTVYALLALFLLGSLAYAVRYEVTHHHTVHAAEVLLVILILVGLLYVGGTYFFPAPIISMVW